MLKPIQGKFVDCAHESFLKLEDVYQRPLNQKLKELIKARPEDKDTLELVTKRTEELSKVEFRKFSLEPDYRFNFHISSDYMKELTDQLMIF